MAAAHASARPSLNGDSTYKKVVEPPVAQSDVYKQPQLRNIYMVAILRAYRCEGRQGIF